MRKRTFTFVFVPHRGGDVRELQLSLPVLVTAVTLVALFVVSSIILVSGIFSSTYDSNQIDVLRRENQDLVGRLTVMNDALSGVRTDMRALVEREREIRILADLPDLDPAERAVGVGGRSQVAVPTGASNTVRDALVLQADLERLVREAEFERMAFEGVYEAILARRDVLDHTPSILPCYGSFTRGFGLKRDPFTGFFHLHAGMDIAAPHGTPVYATADGYCIESKWSQSGYGNVIRIGHGYGFETRYAHLTNMYVSEGDRVHRGEVIGTVGSTGKSTGPHLHYEVRVQGDPVNPKTYILSDVISQSRSYVREVEDEEETDDGFVIVDDAPGEAATTP
jgi:murein DD-endopeptidase MepM/ murein hydrolase activator NlpD